jgi:hypothetical protein
MKPRNIQEFMENWLPAIKKEHHEMFIADVAALMKPPDDQVWVGSTVSSRTGDPLIDVRMGQYSFQVAPEEARRIGRSFEDAASAAELDAFVVAWFRKMEMPEEAAWHLITGLRQYRETRAEDEVRRWREKQETGGHKE